MPDSFPSILAQVYWHAPTLWPVAALAALALAVVVYILYPPQLGAVPWPWRGVLPALRLAAVLVLAASVLKPVARRLATAEERGAVLVLVDRSRSMAVVDNARTPAQLVALADALGKLKPGVRSDAATGLAADMERLRALATDVHGAQDDLDYARVSGRDIKVRQTKLQEAAERFIAEASALANKASALPAAEELTRLLSKLAQPPDSASRDGWRVTVQKQIDDAANEVAQYQETSDERLYQADPEVKQPCDEIARLSRYSLAEQALLRPGGIVASARKKAAVIGASLAEEVAPLELIRGDRPVSALGAAPDGLRSDLTAGIAAAVARQPVFAVVLLSDGTQVGGDKMIVTGPTPSGVPIFTVNAAAALPPRDLTFKSVSVPRSVSAGRAIVVKVELRNDYFEGQSVEVHCQVGVENQMEREKEQIHALPLHKGKDAVTEFTIQLTNADRQHEECVWVWFPLVKGQACGERDETRADKMPRPLPTEQLPAPPRAKNAPKKHVPRENAVAAKVVKRWVKVVPERVKVLLVAGSPTWDFQYVRSALGRMAEMEVKDFVLDPVYPRLPMSPREILTQDVIVLFDVPVAALDVKHWDAVQRMAQVAGGSVILVAGDAHLPVEYAKLPSTAAMLPFLPVFQALWKPWLGPVPAYHFVPAPDAEGVDFLKLPTEPTTRPAVEAAPVPPGDVPPAEPAAPREGEAAELPARRWEELPGCLRFLQLPDIHNKEFKPQARALLVEEESRLPVLTEMRLGAGRAFFMGFNETWRWRYKVGGRDQDHFWRELIQHASEDPYFVHDGPLALDVDNVSAHPNDKIHVRARIIEEEHGPQSAYMLQVLRDHQRISEVPLNLAGPAGGGRYGATLSLPAGEYEIRWTVAGEGHKTHSVAIAVHIGGTSEEELADLAGHPDTLRKLADATGGEFLTLEQVGRLPARLAAAGDARSRYAELPLWDSPYLFALVVGCLGAEWALRKRVGLA
jgi:hypothetical protein